MIDKRNVRLWHIYLVENCHHVKPEPKPKYIVTTCFDGDKIMGFLINSKISNFILKQPDLLVCQAAINANDHPALSHDSYVDCHSLYDFYAWDFNSHRGELSAEAQQSILQAVKDCPTIEARYKKLILPPNDEAAS